MERIKSQDQELESSPEMKLTEEMMEAPDTRILLADIPEQPLDDKDFGVQTASCIIMPDDIEN